MLYLIIIYRVIATMKLLEYLVPSRARRDMLRTLSARRRRPLSVRRLSIEARVAYANAHREVERMRRAGLVKTERVGRALLCSWNEAGPLSHRVRALLQAATPPAASPPDEVVAANLKRWGAPLLRTGRHTERLSLEETLGYGLGLARRRPEVARVWPVVFARHRGAVEMGELEALAYRLGQKRALGFFLALCGALLADPALTARSRRLRDARFRRTEDFFVLERGRRARALAERNTPRLAKMWLFRMNMSLESFRTHLEKFAGV